MRRAAAVLTAVLCWAAASGAQSVPHFYDVDAETRVEGAVQDIRLEPRYEGTAPFLILDLKEKKTARLFQVEISPAWFFSRDLHVGESLRIVGSLVSQPGQPALLIAREVMVQGEMITVRDKKGFPSWRGGPKTPPGGKRGRRI
jgi:hypothetical protein